MSFEDLAVFFVVIFEFLVERSNEILDAFQVVVEPLACVWDEERVSKVIFGLLAGGSAPVCTTRGRTVRKKKKMYDCTKGYPGEDVAAKLPWLLQSVYRLTLPFN